MKMKSNFKYKEMMLKKAGYKYLAKLAIPVFYKKQVDLDARLINIITLEQLAKFLEIK